MNTQVQTIDDYIAGFPHDVRVLLEQIRATIRVATPDATETIKYAMPTFVQHGNLVHFAALKKHIGFYNAPSDIEAFKDDLAVYGQSKGTIRFPFETPVPFELVARIAQFRLEENLRKLAAKKNSRGTQNS